MLKHPYLHLPPCLASDPSPPCFASLLILLHFSPLCSLCKYVLDHWVHDLIILSPQGELPLSGPFSSSILHHLLCFTSWMVLKQMVFFKSSYTKMPSHWENSALTRLSMRKWEQGIAFIHTLTEFFFSDLPPPFMSEPLQLKIAWSVITFPFPLQ